MCECFFERSGQGFGSKLIPMWETQVDKTNKESATSWWDASGFSKLSRNIEMR